jgi:DNA-binding response OmpR family regulator
MKTVLAVDDENDLLELIQYNLEKAGYLVLKARDGPQGLDIAREHRPDLILLDLMLPRMDGWDVCKKLKADAKTSRIPIVMLTAKNEESDKVQGLDLGADDYVTKPFSPRELVARVKAVLRRHETPATTGILSLGELTIDSPAHRVSIGDRTIPLTVTEFNLLNYLAERLGRVVTRTDLIDDVIGGDTAVGDRTIDVHVMSLRRKLGRSGRRIETVRGVGYKLVHE